MALFIIRSFTINAITTQTLLPTYRIKLENVEEMYLFWGKLAPLFFYLHPHESNKNPTVLFPSGQEKTALLSYCDYPEFSTVEVTSGPRSDIIPHKRL